MPERPKRTNAARELRRRAIPAEAVLWKALRNRALGGFKFRRQHPLGPYVADFACVACRVVVELDGETHLSSTRADADRTAFLEREGWHVLRVWNTEVYDELEGVKEAIYQLCVRGSHGA
jgi:very-short-patch-repair endonuclease